MRAASVAAQAGHRVTLLEATGRLGGQVNLAECLPGRAEFGGVTTNLVSELYQYSVDVRLSNAGSYSILEQVSADLVILAVGAEPRMPEVDYGEMDVMDSWAVIAGDKIPGQNVVIADWACDWSGLGLAQMLAEKGHHVRLAVGASLPGESIQGIVRDHWIGELHRLGVEVIPFARLYGADGDTVWFQHQLSAEPIECEAVDGVVTCYAPRSRKGPDWLQEFDGKVLAVGDALSPRTVEEAVLEGHRAGMVAGQEQ